MLSKHKLIARRFHGIDNSPRSLEQLEYLISGAAAKVIVEPRPINWGLVVELYKHSFLSILILEHSCQDVPQVIDCL